MANESQFTCIIPARYQSSRFPGKSLHEIHAIPMILWVAKHASEADRVSRVIIATDDDRIRAVVEAAGYEVVMTSPDCPNGSARVAEVAAGLKDDWVFEMQGDQPMVTSDVIDDFIIRSWTEVDDNSEVEVVIPFAATTEEQTASPDVLKVVVTASNRLVFQTRHPIESGYRTLGLYLWKSTSLQRFSSLPVSRLEQAEDSHPIRLYINDIYVQGIEIQDTSWVEVDRPAHVDEVEKIMVDRGLVSGQLTT